MEALHAHLGFDQAVALTQSSALHGLGGVGKTQIALEYAYRHALEYSAVFWIGAETEESIVTSLLHIAETLKVLEREDKDQQRVIAAVQRWLRSHGQWLLIWDNVEDLDLLHRFLPATRSGATLLTTRSQALGTLAQGLDLLPMAQKEALLFLLRRAKVLEPGATSEHMQQFAERTPVQYAAAAELVSELGGLPLALDQAGAYVEETQCGLPAYLERFRARRTTLLQQRGEYVQDHPASVSTTFTLALTATARRHPAVWDLLHICALLSPDAIPEELFRQGGEVLGAALAEVCRDVLEWDRVVSAACSSSLLSRQSEAQTLSLHRLVQVVVLDSMTEAEREQWITRAISALEAVFPDVLTETTYVAWQQGERLLPHALLCLHPTRARNQSLTFTSLAYKVAQYLQERGWYTEAEPLYQRALHVREQVLGPRDPAVASSLQGLANLYYMQDRFAEAEPLYQRALHVREQVLGPRDPAVASSLQGLANLYCLQGRFAEAEPFYQRALHVREQTLGPTHPLVAQVLVGLAEFYLQQDRYREAEPLYQRALRTWELVLSPDHPLVAYPLNGLAILLREQGRSAEAEPLFRRALRIREQALGSTHPLVASVLTNLAILLQQQGNFSEAEPLFRRALHIREQALGSTHLQVAYPLHGLAILLQQQGNFSEAEPLFRRALAIREEQLGAQHPDRAHTLHDLAILKQQQGKLREAHSLAQQALSIRARALGDTHPKTAATRTLYEQLVQEQAAGAEPTLEHLRTLLKARGWSLHLKKRRDRPYVYATRKVGERTSSRYLAPLSNLAACLTAALTLPNAKQE
jgi:tetratricopeptide (TPR) repeat protein